MMLRLRGLTWWEARTSAASGGGSILAILSAISILAAGHASAQSLVAKQIGIVKISKAGHGSRLADDGLYVVVVGCDLLKMPTVASLYDDPIQSNLAAIFTDPTISASGVVTLSTQPLSTSSAPPAGSVLTAIPFENRTSSKNGITGFGNLTCNQAFIINGHNPLYLTAVYSESVAQAPSQLVAVVGGLAGLTSPLLNVIPGGAAAKPAVEAIAGLGSPYSSILASFNQQGADTAAQPLGPGNYAIITKTAHVRISILKVKSVLSVQTRYPNVRYAFEAQVTPLIVQVQAHPDLCISYGRTLEATQNLAHSDVVYLLSKAVYESGLPPDKYRACLGSEYGPEVYATAFWKSHVNIRNVISTNSDFQPYDRARIDALLYGLKHYAQKSKADQAVFLADFFLPSVAFTDYSDALDLSGTTGAPADLIARLAKAGFKKFGCPDEPDAYRDDHGDLSSANLLALKDPPAKAHYEQNEALLLRVWWQGSLYAPRISRMNASIAGDVMAKVIADNQYACSDDSVFDKPPGK